MNKRINDNLNLAHGAQYHFLKLAFFLTKLIHLALQVAVVVHQAVHGLIAGISQWDRVGTGYWGGSRWGNLRSRGSTVAVVAWFQE